VLFPTATFAAFFTLVFPLSWALRERAMPWRALMLAASYAFYGWWDARFILLLVASSVVNWALARAMDRRDGMRRRAYLALGVAFNIGLLAFFKYAGFLALSLRSLLAALGTTTALPALDAATSPLQAIILPVGISFFTFQALSYAIDVYRRDIAPVGLLDFALFLAFFPQLVAGPIVRASEFLPQLRTIRWLTRADASRAALLVGAGVFKKVAVSSYLAGAIVDPVFGNPGAFSAPELLVAVYAYAVQIYADFSGYTDIAIGVALLLGFRFPQNFDRPYAAVSIRDFWRRWHMTLSRWLRDYLYVPLGGSRKGTLRTYANLLITMALGGLWHGAALTFLAWGVLHGAALAVERALARRLRPNGAPLGGLAALAATIATFHVVCAGWILFRSPSFEGAATVFARLASAWGAPPGGAAGSLATPAVCAVIAAMLALQLAPREALRHAASAYRALPPLAQGALLGAWIFLAFVLSPEGVAPFIYFRF